MKRIVLLFSLLLALLLSGCHAPSPSADTPGAAPETELSLRVTDGLNINRLVLAGKTSGEVYTLDASDVPMTLDGEPFDLSAPGAYQMLPDGNLSGMPVEVRFCGEIAESWPLQLGGVTSLALHSLGTAENPGGSTYDLGGLYLRVLNDLWNADEGLNGNIEYVSVDLSRAPGDLSEGEKAAVAWLFGSAHNVEALTLPYDALIEQGYLREMDEISGAYVWENGVLFTIRECHTEDIAAYSLPVVKFNAEKWRSPLGAYFFSDCSCVWDELSSWSEYHIGSEVIA